MRDKMRDASGAFSAAGHHSHKRRSHPPCDPAPCFLQRLPCFLGELPTSLKQPGRKKRHSQHPEPEQPLENLRFFAPAPFASHERTQPLEHLIFDMPPLMRKLAKIRAFQARSRGHHPELGFLRASLGRFQRLLPHMRHSERVFQISPRKPFRPADLVFDLPDTIDVFAAKRFATEFFCLSEKTDSVRP